MWAPEIRQADPVEQPTVCLLYGVDPVADDFRIRLADLTARRYPKSSWIFASGRPRCGFSLARTSTGFSHSLWNRPLTPACSPPHSEKFIAVSRMFPPRISPLPLWHSPCTAPHSRLI